MIRKFKFIAFLAAAWLLLCFGFAYAAGTEEIRLRANWQIEDLFGVRNFFLQKVPKMREIQALAAQPTVAAG